MQCGLSKSIQAHPGSVHFKGCELVGLTHSQTKAVHAGQNDEEVEVYVARGLLASMARLQLIAFHV